MTHSLLQHEQSGFSDIADALPESGVVALAADNCSQWLAADRACLSRQCVCVPLPSFFTAAQTQWAVESAGVTTLLTDQPDAQLWHQLGFYRVEELAGLHRLSRETQPVSLPQGTRKITFTSGSTGQPKGVCLSQQSQEAVANSIAHLLAALGVKRHLCALPLPVLLENVAGAYAAMLAKIDCVTLPLATVGWRGSSLWDAFAFLQCVVDYQIESVILLPQMLKAVLPLLQQFDLSSLKLVAVGGARVSPDLLQAARQQKMPVYEGYGLSECGSVVCFNHQSADKLGTVGKPLPHVAVRINAAGELEVAGNTFLGYLGQTPHQDAWLATGDIATQDTEGFVRIVGRRKHQIISSFGRNISPEWVESELLAQAGILQAAVFGEAQPFVSAIIFAPSLSDDDVQRAVHQANTTLPDYAQVRCWGRSVDAFSVANGLATANGRNKREAIAQHFQKVIESFYLSALAGGHQ